MLNLEGLLILLSDWTSSGAGSGLVLEPDLRTGVLISQVSFINKTYDCIPYIVNCGSEISDHVLEIAVSSRKSPLLAELIWKMALMLPWCHFSFLTKPPSATGPFAASELEYQWFPTILQLSIHLDATSKPVRVLTPQIFSEALEGAGKTLTQLSGIFFCSTTVSFVLALEFWIYVFRVSDLF